MFTKRSVDSNFEMSTALLANYQSFNKDASSDNLCSKDSFPNIFYEASDTKSPDKSSSSSVSWLEEDTEATKAVQQELTRMQRVLDGAEAIPSHYDRDEYELWIKTFPALSLRVTGKKLDYVSSVTSKGEHCNYEEIIVAHPSVSEEELDDVCDKVATCVEVQQRIRSKLQSAVIQKVFTNVSNQLYKDDSPRKKGINSILKTVKTENYTVSNDKVNLSGALRISPVQLLKNSTGTSLIRNKEAATSTKHFETSKWLQDESPEYASLPHLPPQRDSVQPNSFASVNAGQDVKRTSRNRKQGISAQLHYVTLPPIKVESVRTTQFRSISATPRYQTKCLSAVTASETEIRTHNGRRKQRRLKMIKRGVNVDTVQLM